MNWWYVDWGKKEGRESRNRGDTDGVGDSCDVDEDADPHAVDPVGAGVDSAAVIDSVVTDAAAAAADASADGDGVEALLFLMQQLLMLKGEVAVTDAQVLMSMPLLMVLLMPVVISK
jgi:hypothetical protein